MRDGGSAPKLRLWTVYERPVDYPDLYVARLFEGESPTDQMLVCPDLEPIREELRQRGLTCLPRDDDDEPQIVESWI